MVRQKSFKKKFISHFFIGTYFYLGFVALFTLPKVYENNKTQIDQNIEVVRSKIAELTNKWVVFCFFNISQYIIKIIIIEFVTEFELLFQLEKRLPKRRRRNRLRNSLIKPIIYISWSMIIILGKHFFIHNIRLSSQLN